jgi:two-component system sensor histidine kinase QseC
MGVVTPALVALPLTGLLIWLFVSMGCRSLQRVATQVRARTPEHLDPVDLSSVPREIAAMVESINLLMERLRRAMDREKRFTADAAHELRTPLAGIKLHTQNLAAARNETERQASTDGLLKGIERSERLVSQMLELARMDDTLPATRRQQLSLPQLAQREIAKLSEAQPAYAARLSLSADIMLSLSGDEFLLGLLLRNLLENALRYSGGAVEVHIYAPNGVVQLEVIDHGAGIAADARQRVFGRFHREMGHAESGSGLGLSIVQRIAELHGASVALDQTPGGGLTVRVSGLSSSAAACSAA